MSAGVPGGGDLSRIFERRWWWGGSRGRWRFGRRRRWRRIRRLWFGQRWGWRRIRCWGWCRKWLRCRTGCGNGIGLRSRPECLDGSWPQCVDWPGFECFGRPWRPRAGNSGNSYRYRDRQGACSRLRSGRWHRKPGGRPAGWHWVWCRCPKVEQRELRSRGHQAPASFKVSSEPHP
jgi:hypothetical protein